MRRSDRIAKTWDVSLKSMNGAVVTDQSKTGIAKPRARRTAVARTAFRTDERRSTTRVMPAAARQRRNGDCLGAARQPATATCYTAEFSPTAAIRAPIFRPAKRRSARPVATAPTPLASVGLERRHHAATVQPARRDVKTSASAPSRCTRGRPPRCVCREEAGGDDPPETRWRRVSRKLTESNPETSGSTEWPPRRSLQDFMPEEGVEPTCRHRQRILSPPCLPFHHSGDPREEYTASAPAAPLLPDEPRPDVRVLVVPGLVAPLGAA